MPVVKESVLNSPENSLPDWVVNIENFPLNMIVEKKFFLGVFVAFHVAMEIQMVAAQVGENPGFETHVMNTALYAEHEMRPQENNF